MSTNTYSILLIGIKPAQRSSLEPVLKVELGMQVQSVDSIDQAHAMFDQAPTPDLLLIDTCDARCVPAASHLIDQIKKNSQLQYTPVIVLTAASDQKSPLFWLEQGADDFIDSHAPLPVLIARLKTQLRQKLAIDHLERTALERDLFAAGVLQEISSMRWSISSFCRQAQSKIAIDPRLHQQAIENDLAQLAAYGSQISHYTEALLQGERQAKKPDVAQPQDLRHMLEWLTDLLASSDDVAPLRLAWELPPQLDSVLADANHLKIVLFNLAQHLLAQDYPTLRVIAISQQAGEAGADGQKRIRTLMYDAAISLPASDLAKLFRPYAALASETCFNINLSLVSKLLAKMNGSVFAHTGEAGKGVVYVIELPAS